MMTSGDALRRADCTKATFIFVATWGPGHLRVIPRGCEGAKIRYSVMFAPPAPGSSQESAESRVQVSYPPPPLVKATVDVVSAAFGAMEFGGSIFWWSMEITSSVI